MEPTIAKPQATRVTVQRTSVPHGKPAGNQKPVDEPQLACFPSAPGIAPCAGTAPGEPPGITRTLTLDLGTRFGWSRLEGQRIVESGTRLLATDRELQDQRKLENERTFDIRFGRMLDFVLAEIAAGTRRVVFEDVQFIRSQCQSQLWATLRTAIWAAVRHAETDVSIFCVSVRTLKTFATGNGNADKAAMARALALAEPMRYRFDEATGRTRCDGVEIDDNEVDAIWLARFTAAVDRGERQFLSVQQRKALEKEDRRSRRLAAKAARRARRELQRAEQRAKAQAVRAIIKAAGRCCGVYRAPASRGRAICPKCGLMIKLCVSQAATPTPSPVPGQPRHDGPAVG